MRAEAIKQDVWNAALADELVRRSPTLPPPAEPGALTLSATVAYVGGLLSTAGVLCWLLAATFAG